MNKNLATTMLSLILIAFSSVLNSVNSVSATSTVPTIVETKITTNPTAYKWLQPAISDGRVFWYDYRDSETNTLAEVYMYDTVSKTESRLTNEQDVSSNYPVSASGNKIVYTDREYRLHLYNISDHTNIIIEAPEGRNYAPSISGDKIVYVNYNLESGNRNIYCYDLKTQINTQITDNNNSRTPSIYGNDIVYGSSDGQNDQVYHYDLMTDTEKKYLTLLLGHL